jgi:hypothetical protein
MLVGVLITTYVNILIILKLLATFKDLIYLTKIFFKGFDDNKHEFVKNYINIHFS